MVRARETFSQYIILAVGGILGGGSAQEQGDLSNQKSDEKASYDIERPPPFPPWLGHDGVQCVQAVMQQQVKSPIPLHFFDLVDSNVFIWTEFR